LNCEPFGIRRGRERDLVGFGFNARLALGQALVRTGQGATARKELLELEKTAKARGFPLIANEARESLVAEAAR